MKENRTYRIVRQLADRTLPESYRPMVRRWLVSPENREEKEQAMQKLWTETPAAAEQPVAQPLEKTWQKIRHSEHRQARRTFIRQLARYAAILMLPLLTGITAWQIASDKEDEAVMMEYFVPNGERQTLVLSDGSAIQVNAGSLLVYPSRFGPGKRQVYLSGEANFTVESEPRRPFIVRTGALNVEVLGTKFNIQSYPGSGTIATTLEHGSVKVYRESHPEKTIIMKPNEQLVYHPHEDRFETAQVDAADYAAWTDGELRFINKSLDEILLTMERRYDVRFLIDPQINATDQYNIKFKTNESIDDAIYVLSEILGNITYEREGQTIRLYHKRKGVTR